MSALPPKADIGTQSRNVRFVPKADMETNLICQLLDHFIGGGEQRLRHGQAKYLCGFKVDHRLVLVRHLHRQVSRFLALENAIDVAGRFPVQGGEIGSIGSQAAGGDEGAFK